MTEQDIIVDVHNFKQHAKRIGFDRHDGTSASSTHPDRPDECLVFAYLQHNDNKGVSVRTGALVNMSTSSDNRRGSSWTISLDRFLAATPESLTEMNTRVLQLNESNRIIEQQIADLRAQMTTGVTTLKNRARELF